MPFTMEPLSGWQKNAKASLKIKNCQTNKPQLNRFATKI